MSRSDAELSAYKRPTEYWCNDDEQVKIIERALDMYEASLLGRATMTDRSKEALHLLAEASDMLFDLWNPKQHPDLFGRYTKLRAEIDAALQSPASASSVPEDTARLDWVDRNLCRSGDVLDPAGRLRGIMKCWQVVTQRDDSLRETIDILRVAALKESK